MIVWLNGTFGAGKTSTAGELLALAPGARLFDPETVGYMLRPNLADHEVSDFQHWPPWRPLVVATAVELTRFTGQHLIAPQTVLSRRYLAEILAGLRAAGLDVVHVLLDADDDALRQRTEAGDEARDWRLAHLAAYRQAREWLLPAADLVVDTTAVTPAAAARRVFDAVPALARSEPERAGPPERTGQPERTGPMGVPATGS